MPVYVMASHLLLSFPENVLVLSEHAEPDTFFCFSNLMVEIGQHFTKTLDRSSAGIGQ